MSAASTHQLELPVTTVMSEQGRRTEIVIWTVPTVGHDLFIGIRQSSACVFMYPLNKLLVLHINGCGAVTHSHPDTGRAVISFNAETVREIVVALADVRRPMVH